MALNKIMLHKEKSGEKILAGWNEVVGNKEADMTRAVSFEKGQLMVMVKTAVIYSLLEQMEKPKLLLKLQQKFPMAGLKKIVFRIEA
jgi:predicted nucleic acid-binding Zn ribbon protein